MPRVTIIPKAQLSDEQRATFWQRISDERHALDVGPRNVWDFKSHERDFLAVVDVETGVFVGTVYCHVAGKKAQSLAWWIDIEQRRRGYGLNIADALAAHLKERGVTEIGDYSYQGNYYEASRKIGKRLRSHFE